MKTIAIKNPIPFEQRTTEITLEELKELDSFKDYNEEQAAALLETIRTFAGIVYNIWRENENCGESHTIEMIHNEQNKAA